MLIKYLYRNKTKYDILKEVKKESYNNIERLDKINIDDVLVSAVCITRRRVPFLKKVIDDFLKQSYETTELIIIYDIDDIETKKYLSTITNNKIKSYQNNKKIKLGLLRNIGINYSKGKYIIQWDDDDRYHKKRIEYQLKQCIKNNNKACILDRWIINDVKSNTKYVSEKRYWEGSILCPKELLLKYPYPDMSKGEDTEVIKKLRKNKKIILLTIPKLYIYHLHSNNTWDINHGKKLLKNGLLISDDKEKGETSDRILKIKEIIKSLNIKELSSILDIGGNNFIKFCNNKNYKYTMIDLETPQKTGNGGYYGGGLTYDGRNLPFDKKSFDIVILSFVLHHAANNTFFLLKQVRQITKKYVIIGEDLSEIDYNIKWHNRNYKHQPGGIYRSNEEWSEIFHLLGFVLVKKYIIKRPEDYDDKIYRCIYLLEIDKNYVTR
jgi:glycosyltransferase involved in cell wall biosynthesis